MRIDKFFKSFDYQKGTADDDIRVTIFILDEFITFTFSEWKEQPYYILKGKIANWRIDVTLLENRSETNLCIEACGIDI